MTGPASVSRRRMTSALQWTHGRDLEYQAAVFTSNPALGTSVVRIELFNYSPSDGASESSCGTIGSTDVSAASISACSAASFASASA